MVNIARPNMGDGWPCKVRCLSTDDKPVEGITNGSTLVEIDTGKKYMYNAASGTWVDHGSTIIADADDTEY